jgi:hypothetical protein
MIGYFKLQFKMLNRKIIDFGIPLLIGYTLFPFVFILMSNYLFKKTEFANYIYLLSALSIITKLSDSKRNDFLKSIFKKNKYRKLRAIENIIYALPFTLFLIFINQFVFSAILNLLVILITLVSFNRNLNVTIPTPFSQKPFEYTVGFRKTFFVFPIAYFLTYISVTVGNFNLGIFSMLLIGITCFSYYPKIENEYYIWNYNLSSKEFLLEKTKTCLINFTLLSLPIVVTLGILFFDQLDILMVFFLASYAYLTAIIFAKYSSFPNEMNMSQGILIAISLMFPPILLIFIPLFYSQSIKKLKSVLND